MIRDDEVCEDVLGEDPEAHEEDPGGHGGGATDQEAFARRRRRTFSELHFEREIGRTRVKSATAMILPIV